MHQWLNLDSCWSIDDVKTNVEQERVAIYISYSGKDLVAQRRESLDLFNWKCFIHCRIPRVQTPKGPKTVSIPWADPSSRFTYAYECFAILS